MKKLFLGTFEQVEPGISESFVKNSLNTVKDFGVGKALAFIVLFIVVGSYAFYGVSVYMGSHMEKAVGNLDVNNEFIPFLSSFWYVNIQVLPLIILIISTLWFRKRNRVKGHLVYYSLITVFMIFFGLLGLKVTQLFVSYFIVRLLYTLLFIVTFIYSFWQSYQNAVNMIYTPDKERSFIVEWFSKNSVKILAIIGVLGGAYFAGKSIFQPATDLETRIIGSMIDFFPLMIIVSNFGYIYFNSVILRSFYLYKYAEKFRLKFEYDKEDWYGPKYNEYKNS